jgi:hypothetical protein
MITRKNFYTNNLLDNYKINSDKGCENHNDIRWEYEQYGFRR